MKKSFRIALASGMLSAIPVASPALAVAPAETVITEVFGDHLLGSTVVTEARLLTLPADTCATGGLDINVETSDSYEGRARTNQKREQVVVELLRDGSVLATTEPSTDLPDGFESTRVHSNVGLLPEPAAGDQIRVRHAWPEQPDSIFVNAVTMTPVCAPEPETVIETVIVEKEVEREVEKEVETGDSNDLTCQDGINGLLSRMYDVYFNRFPDADGVRYWSQRLATNMTVMTLSQFFYDSPEFGQLFDKNLSDEEFLRLVYRNGFERDPDAAGLQYWVDQLAQGKSRSWAVVAMMVQPEALSVNCDEEHGEHHIDPDGK